MADRKVLFRSGANVNQVSPTGDDILVGGVKLGSLTSDPASPADGQVWYNSTDKRVRAREDGVTKDVTVATFAVTAGELIEAGSLVYISANNTVLKADQSNTAKINVVGAAPAQIANAATGQIQQTGKVTLRMAAGLTLAAGDQLWLSTGGQATNVAPASNGVVKVGRILDASGYADPGNLKAVAVLQIFEAAIA